jgi:hypothetical protein
MALGFNRGPESPIEVSDAERLAVSTDPGSPLQKAISGQQFLDKGFLDTGSLLAGGPKAFDVAQKAAMGRSDIRAQMAGKAMELTDRALRTRGTQAGIDKASAQQAEADDFFDRTAGMSVADQLSEATAREHGNPTIKAALQGRASSRRDALGIEGAELTLRGAGRKEAREVATEAEDLATHIQERKNDAVAAAGVASELAEKANDESADMMGSLIKLNMEDAGVASISSILRAGGPQAEKLNNDLGRVGSIQKPYFDIVAAYPDEDFGDEAVFETLAEELQSPEGVSEETFVKMARLAHEAQEFKVEQDAKARERSTQGGLLKDAVALHKAAESLSNDESIERLDDAIALNEKLVKIAQDNLDVEFASEDVEDEELEPFQEAVRKASEQLEKSIVARREAKREPSSAQKILRAQSSAIVRGLENAGKKKSSKKKKSSDGGDGGGLTGGDGEGLSDEDKEKAKDANFKNLPNSAAGSTL